MTGVGFGFVYLRAIDGRTELLAEDLTHGFDDPLGAEALAYFARSAWLRKVGADPEHAWRSRYRLDPATALERVYLPGEQGWQQQVTRVHRGDGPRWQHEVDETTAALLAGMRPDGLPLYELLELLALAEGSAEVAPDFADAALGVVTDLVRHGLVHPV